MQILLIVLLLLLVLILVAITIGFKHSDENTISAAYEGGEDVSTTFLVNDIMNKFAPYLDSLEKSKGTLNIITYLCDLYEKPKTLSSGRKHPDAADLRELLKQIVSTHNFSSANDFITKSHISYLWFLPDNKKLLLLEGQHQYVADSRDKREIETAFKEISNEIGAGLSAYEITAEIDKFVKLNKVYKFRDNVCNYAVAKLKKLIKTDPTKVFETDSLGVLSRIKEYLSDWPKTKTDTSNLSVANLKRIYDYLDRLKIITYDPYYVGAKLTLSDLEHRLQTAVNRLVDTQIRDYNREARERETRERETREREVRERERREQENRERQERETRERRERENQERERHEHEKEKEKEPDEAELQEEFYRRIQADPELEQVAAAMNMSLHDLYEQYKLEKAASVAGGSGDKSDDIDEQALQKLKHRLVTMSRNTY